MTTLTERESLAVAVAADVLKRLNAGWLNVRRGRYIDSSWALRLPDGETLSGLDLRDVADEVEAACNVCALGAMLLSLARIDDNVPLGGLAYATGSGGGEFFLDAAQGVCVCGLGRCFDLAELGRIEAAFELSPGLGMSAGLPTGESQLAAAWGRRYPNLPDRLRAICESVVANGGHFRLTPEE